MLCGCGLTRSPLRPTAGLGHMAARGEADGSAGLDSVSSARKSGDSCAHVLAAASEEPWLVWGVLPALA